MPAAIYATVDDVKLYLRDLDMAPQQQTIQLYLGSVSRWLDAHLGQYFYADGLEEKQFNSEGEALIDTGQHPFYGKIGKIAACGVGATSLTFTLQSGPAPADGDVFLIDVGNLQEQVTVSGTPTSGSGSTWTLTLATPTTYAHSVPSGGFIPASTILVKLAYFENQPAVNWTPPLSGNGLFSPSNYFLWPPNRPNAGSSSDPSQRRPWYGLDIANIPLSGTTFLPGSIPGYRTISITAHWGWPVVPDVIKDLCCKIVARLWRAREAGWAQQLASTDTGMVTLLNKLDEVDRFLLTASDYKLIHL